MWVYSSSNSLSISLNYPAGIMKYISSGFIENVLVHVVTYRVRCDLSWGTCSLSIWGPTVYSVYVCGDTLTE